MPLQRPIASLLASDASGIPFQVKVSVVPMTKALARQWHESVQPIVDNHYSHEGFASQKVRADVGWRWPNYLKLVAIHNYLTRMPGNASEKGKAMCVVVSKGEQKFPIGMLSLVPKLHCNVQGVERQRAFTWYLSDAPAELYEQFLRQPTIRGVAKALIDCTIQAALDEGDDGALLLHADPNGGRKLVDFYTSSCKMRRLSPKNGIVTAIWRRRRPDEYFHFTGADAQAFSALYDHRC
ncbi:hypothetical protein BK666_30650 [Pseudomonas frederiksbergensis]|uniref:Uncharacterized protein n=1 Tax=Pseudomonas frederiksbergensis TaxID=104087 RepID=A0A423JK77_9PSED|nr:hypothetical protein [Pseudomonas frederiksbergensis]RON38111.1 hypothetical protein BK666_30650 [Pseudomonas frederiksbergensis]